LAGLVVQALDVLVVALDLFYDPLFGCLESLFEASSWCLPSISTTSPPSELNGHAHEIHTGRVDGGGTKGIGSCAVSG
jgi:hypothetical protein